MKILDYLKRMPIGEVAANKRFLAILKRKGLIYDYSPWGYLEARWVERTDGYRSLEELFPLGNAGSFELNHVSEHDWWDKYKIGGKIEYKGFTFDTKYLSGCFKPYLIKVGGPVENNTERVSRTISMGVFGGGTI